METFIIRKLEKDDYHKNYLDLLSQLSSIDKEKISENDFNVFLNEKPNNINIFVIYDNKKNKICGSGTVVIESKLIHNFGKVGHIEDVVVDETYRGYGLGKLIVDYLVDYAKSHNCYKVLLMCNDKNIEFYKKLGFNKKDNAMTIYF
jgi:glucosamine-phosphate N-acetyltransferase